MKFYGFGLVLVLTTSLVHSSQLHQQKECRLILDNCTDTVYPHLHNSEYMFPTSLESVNQMCKMWSQFVDCIRRYISHCFEENRRVLFHKSVENSIDTVHAICSSKMYQNEYLTKAACFKQISMDHCGKVYNQLIEIVANPNSNDEHICCAYAKFRECVNRPLLQECGRKAKNLMDHSMSFLITRCNHYSYGSEIECSKPEVYLKNIDTFDVSAQDDTPPDSPENSITEANLSSMIYESDTEPKHHDDMMVEERNSDGATSLVDDQPNEPTGNIEEDVASNRMENNENSINVVENIESEPDMIVYTIKPESQISSASMARITFQLIHLAVLISLSTLFTLNTNSL